MKTVTDKLEVSDVDGDGLAFLATKFWLNWIGLGARRGKLVLKFWKPDTELHEHQGETSTSIQNVKPLVEDAVIKNVKEEPGNSFSLSAKETLKAAIMYFGKKWYRRISFIGRQMMHIIGSFQKLWNIAGIHLNLDIPKWMHVLHLDKLNSNTVQWLEARIKAFESTYLYTMEKGYFLLPESAKSCHNIRTMNISISAHHSCFGNRWQQLLINRVVGYDTILINSLLSSPGQGYLYNNQTKEFYNLSYAQEPLEGPARFGDYLATKCGVLMMSLFVFFTTTMSVSFTLRETQTHMLKFTGFSYLALSTTAAFMQHLILYFWNSFEVPALQRFMQNRRSQLQQHPDFRITSSTIFASTLHITRLNTRNQGSTTTDLTSGEESRPESDPSMPRNGRGVTEPQPRSENDLYRVGNPVQIDDLRQAENGPNPGSMNSFSSLLLWILGGASSESINSLLSMFRDVRDQGQVLAEPPPGHDNRESQNGR